MKEEEIKLKDFKKEGISLSKVRKPKKDDIVIAKVLRPVTAAGAQMIIKSLKGTFPKNKVLLVCDGADISFIKAKSLNRLGWFKKEESRIITLDREHKAGCGLKPDTERPKPRVRP